MKRIKIVLAAAALGAVLAACAPVFQGDDTVTASPIGPLVRITWGSASPGDDTHPVAQYGIEVGGVEVAKVPSTWTSCVLTGLSNSTTYTLSVTAYDNTGAWSGNYSGTIGRISTSYTTPATGNAGPTRACVSPTDTDGDGLPNAVENGGGTYASAAATGTSASLADTDGDRLGDGVESATGAYVSTSSTGSNPNIADTDGDNIKDGDEVLGTTAGLDLPGMGARPVHKDLLFEYDWFDDAVSCSAHSHRPTVAMIDRVKTAYANGPVPNPDGVTGVNVIADYGQGGLFTGGSVVADADGVLSFGVNNAEYVAVKTANFAANRNGYFHYVLMPHQYNGTSASSGQAEINGDDLIVSMMCYFDNTNYVANTIMHETGHNLGLRHGGNVDLPNYKPNYNSVMNYQYQFVGIDTDCLLGGNGVLDYSTGSRAPLDENALLETNGLCNGVDIDWNLNATIDAAPVVKDINNADGFLNVLTDYDDWGHISFSGLNDADGAPLAPTEVVTEQPLPKVR